VVSPRPPRSDGQGDQRRAHEIVAALSAEWEVDVVSWLPDVDEADWRRWGADRSKLPRALALAAVLPAGVAYVQSRAPGSVRTPRASHDAVVFVTDRAVPRRLPSPALVDFVDDLGGAALRRAGSCSGLRALFWRLEGTRIRRLDRRLAGTARLCVSHSPTDAAGIGPGVRSVPLSVGTTPLPDTGERIAFFGNLFYAPNHEAAMWICAELAPRLAAQGVGPERILIAGRRPYPSLLEAAARAGVELRADVADLDTVLAEAAVVLAPMTLGSGSQYKVLDAVGAGRACVISPVANSGLGLVDGRSAMVRERAAAPFADAVLQLLAHPSLRARLVAHARTEVAAYMPEQVAETWRALVREVLGSPMVLS